MSALTERCPNKGRLMLIGVTELDLSTMSMLQVINGWK